LLVTSNDGTQSGRSGYDVLADYVEGGACRVVRYPRRDARGLLEKVQRRVVGLRAASTAYLVSSWELEKRTRAAIREERPDIVHLLWANRDWGRIDRVTTSLGIPLFCTVHNCPDTLAPTFPSAEPFRRVAGFILMSSHQKPFFLERGVPEERLHVVLHGIDTKHFVPPETRDRHEPFRILTVGHTRRDFGMLRQLTEAMEADGCTFRVISKPAFGRHFDGQQHVTFESGISNKALLEAYQSSDVLVMTAEEATANNALLEALSCGLPVVSERVGGLPEYLGEAGGLVVPPKDPQALRQAILKLKADQSRWENLSVAARKRAETLDWQYSAKRIGELYRAALR